MKTSAILTIDQGTSSTRAFIVTTSGNILAQAQAPIDCFYPHPDYVEQDPMQIIESVILVCREAISKAISTSKITLDAIKCAGITNQRETIIAWDSTSGTPIYPAIVWQDKRTSAQCDSLKSDARANMITSKTGLLIDPYFSSTKIQWLLKHVPNAKSLIKAGKLRIGTVDSFIIWHLTNGRSHLTDITNASRTQLFNIHTLEWDPDLLELFSIPREILPRVHDCDAHFGEIDASIFGQTIPITGVIGDQQSALVGQACLKRNAMKMTYGTGGFLMVNTGSRALTADNGLLTTIAYRMNGELAYALEGALFNAGTTIKWLRDEMGILQSAEESETLARSVPNTDGVYIIPAFTGLGAPYWNAEAKAAIVGLGRYSNRAHIARAALEAVCFQTAELLELLPPSIGEIRSLRVDGGMVSNNWLMQALANITQLPIERPEIFETTVMGAATVAAVGAGMMNSLEMIEQQWKPRDFAMPQIPPGEANEQLDRWKEVVKILGSSNV